MDKLSGRDLSLLALLTLFWGLNWPVMKIGVRDFGPMSFRALSMVGGLLVLAAMIRAQRLPWRVARRDWAELLRLAVCNMTVWFVLAIYGIKLLASGKAAILGYTLPIWSAIWGIVFFGERPSRRLWIGLVAAAIGVALLLGEELSHMTGKPIGAACMLGAAAVWAFGTHLMNRRRLRVPITVITFWSLLISLVICGALAALLERDQWVRWPDAAEWGAVLYNAVLIFGFCQLIWFRLVGLLPPVASGLSVMLIPVVGLFSSMALLGETPGWQDYMALASILVAIATVLWPARR
ncbi:MAG: DMT family transporter [Burkholderiaceae bacterium]